MTNRTAVLSPMELVRREEGKVRAMMRGDTGGTRTRGSSALMSSYSRSDDSFSSSSSSSSSDYSGGGGDSAGGGAGGTW